MLHGFSLKCQEIKEKKQVCVFVVRKKRRPRTGGRVENICRRFLVPKTCALHPITSLELRRFWEHVPFGGWISESQFVFHKHKNQQRNSQIFVKGAN